MGDHKIRRTGALVAIGALVAFMTLPGVAFAGPNEKSTSTEDNDGNDGGTLNNVSDDGDNKHPSGKDRSVENGGSGTQGKSSSDPDDDGRGPDRSNGGPDKADGWGGMDKADQDGNNGCGNDDDFEDDNEGWCGKHPKKDSTTKIKGSHKCDRTMKTHGKSTAHRKNSNKKSCDHDSDEVSTDGEPEAEIESEVLGATTETKPDDPNVLGLKVEKARGADAVAPATAARGKVAGGALPFTGASILIFVMVALGLLTAGALLIKGRRSQA